MKKIMFLGIILVSVFAFYSVGQAAITTPAGSSETVANQGILPRSGPTAVLGISMTATAGETLTAVTVTFTSTNSNELFTPATDLAALALTDSSGVAIYKDTAGSIDGEFDSEDNFIIPSVLPNWAGNSVTISFAAQSVPSDNTTAGNVGPDFFVVIRTSDTISGEYYGGTGGDKRDKFTVSFPTASIQFDGAGRTPTGTTITDTITCESRVVDLTPMRSDTNSYTNASNTYYPGDYPGDSTYRFKHFVPYELEDPDNDYYWYDGPLPPKSQLLSMFTYTAVLGIDCAAPRGCTSGGSNTEYLSNVIATFTDTGTAGNFDPTTDIYDVSLWRDDGDGIFDSSLDSRISWHYPGDWTVTLVPNTYGGEPIASIVNNTVDYFVVIRTNPWRQDVGTRIPYGADFKVSAEPTGGAAGPVDFSVAKPDSGLCRTAAVCKEIKAVLEMHNYVYNVGSYGRIDATSGPVPVIGINTADGNVGETLLSIKVTFSGTNFTPSDLAPLSTGLSSGVSLWLDSKSNGNIGTFDPVRSRYDTIVPIYTPTWVDKGGGEYFVILYPQTALQLLDDDTYTDTNRGDDYFICVRTSESIEYLDTIVAEVKDTDIQFGGAKSAVGSSLTANSLTANVLVSLTDLTSYGQLMEQNQTIPCLKIYCKRPAATAVSLESLVCQIDDLGTGTFGIGDLMPLTEPDGVTPKPPGESGIAVYKDNGDGVFGAGDTGLALFSIELCNLPTEDFYRVELVLNAADPISAGGNTYFLVIRTSNNLNLSNDSFVVRLWGSMVGSDAEAQKSTRALGFDQVGTQSRTYERLETNVLGPTPSLALARPMNLEAIPGVNVITLRWDDNSDGEDGFNVERKIAGTDSSSYENVGSVAGSPLGWKEYDNVITDTEIDHTYTYRVRAYTYTDVGGDPPSYEYDYSLWSNEDSAKSYSFSHTIGGSLGGTGCFIATAAFGTELAEEVITLKRFRDEVLMKTATGRDFVRFYYAFSPPIADFIRNKSLLKTIVREYLEPLIWFSKQITK